MEAKQYIRTYEQLKNEKNNNTIQEQIQLEKKWMVYYKEVDFVIRKMTKKQKAQLEPFKEKAFNELKKVSTQLFFTLTEKKESEFNRLLKQQTSLFFKKGTQGLLQMVNVDFEAALKKVQKNEQVMSKNHEDWIHDAKQVCQTTYTTLTEAYQTEEAFVKLFYWWKQKVGKSTVAQELQAHYVRLCRSHNDLINFMLQEMGYTFKMEDVFRNKSHKSMLRLQGFIPTLQFFENEQGFLTPLMDELLQEIRFIHPKDEFEVVRQMKRHFVLHIGPTNSGKTYQANEALGENTPLAPVHCSFFQELFVNSPKLDAVICSCTPLGEEYQLWYMDKENVEEFKKHGIEIDNIEIYNFHPQSYGFKQKIDGNHILSY